MSQYPEHDKMHLIKDKSQAIGEFLEWLEGSKGIVLAEYPEKNPDNLFPVYAPSEKLLAEFFDIDLQKIGEEKDAMLEEMRAMNSVSARPKKRRNKKMK